MMKKIGITGNIGTGKTVVGQVLLARGEVVLDVDDLVAKLYENDDIKNLIQEKFSYFAFHDDGSVNKRWLANKIFDDDYYRFWLQKLLWPRVRTQVELWIFGQEQKKHSCAYVIAPLLFEASWQDLFDEIWLIYSRPADILERIQVRDRINFLAAKKRLASQMPDSKKRPLVQVIINNYGTIGELRKSISDLLK